MFEFSFPFKFSATTNVAKLDFGADLKMLLCAIAFANIIKL